MKNKLWLALLLAAPLILSAGCFRQDIRTITVQVPMMKSADCSKIIQDALGRIEGVLSAEPDLQEHTIAVTYDARKLAIRNIQYLIAGVGFDADDLPGKPDVKATLPAGCR
jgi:copper chaperone CopZ